jgi:hypothetical protein
LPNWAASFFLPFLLLLEECRILASCHRLPSLPTLNWGARAVAASFVLSPLCRGRGRNRPPDRSRPRRRPAGLIWFFSGRVCMAVSACFSPCCRLAFVSPHHVHGNMETWIVHSLLDVYLQKRPTVPKFGTWDSGDAGYTAYFDKVRENKGATAPPLRRPRSPNDPDPDREPEPEEGPMRRVPPPSSSRPATAGGHREPPPPGRRHGQSHRRTESSGSAPSDRQSKFAPPPQYYQQQQRASPQQQPRHHHGGGGGHQQQHPPSAHGHGHGHGHRAPHAHRQHHAAPGPRARSASPQSNAPVRSLNQLAYYSSARCSCIAGGAVVLTVVVPVRM